MWHPSIIHILARSALKRLSKCQIHVVRPHRLVTMKIDTPEFHRLFTPELKELKSVFDKYGYELRIAGGAIRDLLTGIQPHDVDFATTATPDQMKEIFERESIHRINTNGEKHGTILVRINNKENFDLTTLGIDVKTDGRHAEVEFTKDWLLDANRRDFTINAMFLDFDGTLYDYFNGKEDLEARRVRFVGPAAERIPEDYLRILRYFRIYGRIAEGPDSHEKEILDAIKNYRSGLGGISGARIWVELKKILCGRFNGPIMQTMLKLGIGPYIGLTENINLEEFQRVCDAPTNQSAMPITILTGLLCSKDDEEKGKEKGEKKKKSQTSSWNLVGDQVSAIDQDLGPPISCDSNTNYKTIKAILTRLTRSCLVDIGGDARKPRKHEQRLLRNMGAHTVVLDLLKIPYDTNSDIRMVEIMRLAHEFLQGFCLGNQPNQNILYGFLDLFLSPGYLKHRQ